MPSIKIGQVAPDFSLTDKSGIAHKLSAVKSAYSIVYFYPKDDTPGCTIEAKEFSDALAAFEKLGVSVFGVSGGDDKTKAKFCTKYNLKVPLLSDKNFSVAKAYEAYGEKKFMGRTFNGIFRKTFVLDKSRKIVQIFDSVKPEGHAKELLAMIKKFAKAKTGKATSLKPAASKSESVKSSGERTAKKSPAKSAPVKKGSLKRSTVKRASVERVPVNKTPLKKATAKKASTKPALRSGKVGAKSTARARP